MPSPVFASVSQRRAIFAFNRAQRSNSSVSELHFRPFGASHGERVRRRLSTAMPGNDPDTEFDCLLDKKNMPPPQSTSEATQSILAIGNSRILDFEDASEEHSNDLEYGEVVVRQPLQRPGNPVAECRAMSGSAWLYFPHLELLFLLFAFEGVVAAQVAAVRNAQHTPLRIVSSLVLVSTAFVEAFPSIGDCLTS